MKDNKIDHGLRLKNLMVNNFYDNFYLISIFTKEIPSDE